MNMTGQIAFLAFFTMAQAPSGPQPQFAIVRSIDKAQGEVKLSQIQAVSEVVPVKSIVNGQEVTRNVVKRVMRTVEKQFSIDKGTVYDTAGKKVAAPEVWKRL